MQFEKNCYRVGLLKIQFVCEFILDTYSFNTCHKIFFLYYKEWKRKNLHNSDNKQGFKAYMAHSISNRTF